MRGFGLVCKEDEHVMIDWHFKSKDYGFTLILFFTF